MAGDAFPEHVRALQSRTAYPGKVAKVELIQTHISWVFLADNDVYKIKKPVNFGFADFTTLAKRHAACEAEVRLNRRGCAGNVYRGVVPITREAGSYRVDGTGEVVDYAVSMKRLPAGRMMDKLLERGEVDFEMIGRVAARLAALHAEAERGDEISRIGGAEAMRANWQQNLDQVMPFAGRTLSKVRLRRLEMFGRNFLAREMSLLEQREAEGWVRDCHGDLRSDSVVFDPEVPGGICIYDCIEFNEAFRYIDTGLDAAFLAMDLDYRGHSDLSDLFAGLFAAAAGDKMLPVLLHFYKCYRAIVRGKVESLLLDDPGIPAKQKAAARRRARAYFELAESYARRRPGRDVVLVSGPSGSGKSVLAGVLASRLGAVLLSTDMLRLELFERAAGSVDAVDQGRYTPAARGRVYEEIERQAEAFAGAGRPVVIDGTYIERGHRAPIVELAGRAEAPLLVVECHAPDEVVRRRQQQRLNEAWTTSEGRWEVYLAQKARIEPATELSPAQRVQIDTTTPLEEQIDAVVEKLRQLRQR